MVYMIGVPLKTKYEAGKNPPALVEFLETITSALVEEGGIELNSWSDLFKIVQHETRTYVVFDITPIQSLALTVDSANLLLDRMKQYSMELKINASSSMSIKSVVANVN